MELFSTCLCCDLCFNTDLTPIHWQPCIWIPWGKTQLAKLEGSVWWGQRSKWEPKLFSIVVLSQTAQPAQLPLQLSHSNLTYKQRLLFCVYSSLAKHLHTSTHTRMFTCPNFSFKLTVYNCLHRTFYIISIMYSETLWSPHCFHSPSNKLK